MRTGRTRPRCAFTAATKRQADPSRRRLGREPEPAGASAEWVLSDGRVAINHVALTMANREAWLKQLRISAKPRGQVQLAGKPWGDPQRLHQRPERLRRRVPLRAAARNVGRRHRRRDQLGSKTCQARAPKRWSTAPTPRVSASRKQPRSRPSKYRQKSSRCAWAGSVPAEGQLALFNSRGFS